MKLTERLFDYLSRVFSRDPERKLALRFRYAGTLVITIEDAVLTTAVTGGIGESLTVDLRDFTIAELADYIAAQPGYSVEYENPLFSSIGAIVLLDTITDQDTSNGDHLYGYTSQLRSFLEAYSEELTTARKQIPQVIRQMAVPTAEQEWLDELGSYYKVPRNAGEPDNQYGPRMIAEVLLPRNNNIAIEEAIRTATGVEAEVIDAELQEDIDVGGGQLADSYGLFDIEALIDLGTITEDISIDGYAERVYALIDKFRSGGTHLRLLTTRVKTTAMLNLAAVTISGIEAKVFQGGGFALSDGQIFVAAATQTFEISTVHPVEA